MEKYGRVCREPLITSECSWVSTSQNNSRQPMRNRAEAMAKPSLKRFILWWWWDKDLDLQTHILQGELSF